MLLSSDHNVFRSRMERYQQGENAVKLIGEEVHDVTRSPQKNHLLVLGAGREMSTIASKPQQLIDQVLRAKGLAFIAHPYDPELKAFGEDDISWVDWNVRGFTGIELWNGFSEFKSVVHSYLEGIFTRFFRVLRARPAPSAKEMDELTTTGQRIVAVAVQMHTRLKRAWAHSRTIFLTITIPAINNHLLVTIAHRRPCIRPI